MFMLRKTSKLVTAGSDTCTRLQLRGTEHEVILRTMELFAYGTWADYKGVIVQRYATRYTERLCPYLISLVS